MPELVHRIKVFVFRLHAGQPDYLLLKPDQGIEGLWGPLQGPLGFGEKLEGAIRRQVMAEIGVPPPAQLVDLDMPGRISFGDEEIVEWPYGYQSETQPDPERIGAQWAAYRWVGFADAYPTLTFDEDRAAILRLHTLLGAA